MTTVDMPARFIASGNEVDDLKLTLEQAFTAAAKIVRKMNMHPNYTIADALDAIASTYR